MTFALVYRCKMRFHYVFSEKVTGTIDGTYLFLVNNLYIL